MSRRDCRTSVSTACAPVTTAMPIVARCQRSAWSTSATAACVARSRSLSRLSTCRLSFRDCACGRCNSARITATYMMLVQRAGDLLERVGLDQVPDLDIVEALEADAALE